MTEGSLSTIPRRRLELRRKHPRLIYNAFQGEPYGNGMRIRFDFLLEPDIEFHPETVFESVDLERLKQVPLSAQENLYFHLGMVEAFSYWKAACAPRIVVEQPEDVPECTLDDAQIAWWLDLLRRGMGEYFYVNRIDWRAADFVRIISGPHRHVVPRSEATKDMLVPGGRNDIGGTLVLVSGGKDSVVTLETLKAAGKKFDCLLLNPTQAALDIVYQAGCEKPIIVRRTIDPRLLELNAAGYLNGHTPFSALLAFLGVTVAALYGHRRVIVSNERSAEEANVQYLGHSINHQYSKTFQFETAFRGYCAEYLAPQIEYFSLLRPLYELQIARRFADYPQYFLLFRSCNRGQATNSWCGRCSKCLFVWTVLYPFVDRPRMLRIFSFDLFDGDGAAGVLRALLGLDEAKPFECVGTREETLAALHLCAERYRAQGLQLPAGLAGVREILNARPDLPRLAERILSSSSGQHFIPDDLVALVTDEAD